MFEAIERETGKRLTVYATQGEQFLIDAGDDGFRYQSMERFAPVRQSVPLETKQPTVVEKNPCAYTMPHTSTFNLDVLLDGIASGGIPVALDSSIAIRLLDGTEVDLAVTEITDKTIRLESRDCLGVNTSATNLESYLAKVYALLPDALKERIIETERVHIDGRGKRYTELCKLFVPAASEIFPPDECYGDKGLYQQLEWYKNVHNRVRADRRAGDSHWYWTSSPNGSDSATFCIVNSNGSADRNIASNAYGLAPFGCIISKTS